MKSEFDEDVGFWRECENCDYREQVSSAPADAAEGEPQGCICPKDSHTVGSWTARYRLPECPVHDAPTAAPAGDAPQDDWLPGTCWNAEEKRASEIVTEWLATSDRHYADLMSMIAKALKPSVPAPDRAARDAARQVVTTVLGFNQLDNLAELPPEHPNRKHVEMEVTEIISRHFPPTEAAVAGVEAAVGTDLKARLERVVAEHHRSRTHQPTYCCPEDEAVYDRLLVRMLVDELRITTPAANEEVERCCGEFKQYQAQEIERLHTELSEARAERLQIQRALASTVLNDPTEDDEPPYTTSEMVHGVTSLENRRRAAVKRAADARVKAIGECVAKVRGVRIDAFNGVGSETMKEKCVAALQSLADEKGGADGPTD